MGTYANFYNSDNGDRVYDADSFSEWLRPFFKTGVFNGELQVLASSGMEVIVDTGNAFIEGKLKKFDSQTTLTVEQASANSTRIDSVICRRNDTDRDFTLMIVKGTTVAPLPVRENGIYDIVLAHITVPASAVEIKQENIADTRMNADICGWVVSNVEEVDFSQVSAQWADYIANFEANELQAFNEWFDTIKGQLSTDQAGSLQLQIDEQANKIATNTANISANKADIDSISADITSLQQTTSTNTSDIQAIKARDDEQDSSIASLEERLYKVNDGENTINANGGSIRGIKLYGRSLQDGTPTPDNPIEIKSVVNPKLEVCGKNLLNPTLQTQTINGITCTKNNGDGTYTLNGTATDQVQLMLMNGITYSLLDKKILGCPSGGSMNTYCLLVSMYDENGNYKLEAYDTGDGVRIYNDYSSYAVSLLIRKGITCDNLVFKPMITTDLNATYDDFEPYQGNEATLPYTLNAIPVTSGGNVTIDGQQYVADYVDIEEKKLHRLLEKVNVLDLQLKDDGIAGDCHDFLTDLEKYDSNNYIARKIPIASNKFISNKNTLIGVNEVVYRTIADAGWEGNSRLMFRVPSEINTLDLFKQYVGNDCYVIYQSKEPITIDLTDEEVQAFKSLHTYEGITNIIDSSDQISGSHKFIYNIAEAIDNQYANIDKLNQLVPVTLGTSWAKDTTNGYYTQSIICSGITSKDNPTVDVVLSGTLKNMQSQQENWGKILKIETSSNTLKFYASEPTTVSLSVMVKGV